ncbi:MAG: DNA/RNA non-specific endonuclease [Prevotella sp.]|nr:DNA/RNA non-specific endonuclease [Prevotella sp.]
MKHFVRLSILFACVVALSSCGNDVEFDEDPLSSDNKNCNTIVSLDYGNLPNESVIRRLEFPKLKNGRNNYLIVHNASFGVNYCVEWDSNLRPEGWDWSNDGGTLRSQRWSCWQWHAGNSSSNTTRKPYNQGGDFSEYPNDPNLPSQYHFTADPYWNTGYQHGHIMASADRGYGYNSQANIQTFYMTNMQPQVNGFNAYVWASMEAQARAWNSNNFRDTLYVVKGGTIDKKEHIIRTLGSGRNRIPVPKYFFMALLCKNKDTANGGYKALGFWIQHQSNTTTNPDLTPYVVNIRELERLTGIDFFCNLPDNIENAVETLSRDNIIRAWNLE